MPNKNLQAAKAAKKDEFYTQLTDIEKELRHYKDHFMGKTVLCNCDDPRKSNFFVYFSRDERPLLDNAGTVSHEYAKEYAEMEFERYRIIQDRLFRSDCEKMQLEGGDLPE